MVWKIDLHAMLYHYRSNAKSFITKQALVQMIWERRSKRIAYRRVSQASAKCPSLPQPLVIAFNPTAARNIDGKLDGRIEGPRRLCH